MWLFALFIAVPMLEIALFITVGGWLTLWPTLGIVLATGILGTWLIRRQGRKVMLDLHGSMQVMGNPLSPLAHGSLIILAGALLISPGFFTDTLGFLLLIPAVRQLIITLLARRVQMTGAPFGHDARRRDDVVDGEFIDLDAQPPQKPGSSGWTRH